MARMQWMARKGAARLYLSIGMADSDIKKMIRMELQGVLLRTCICFVFFFVTVNTCFGMLVT